METEEMETEEMETHIEIKDDTESGKQKMETDTVDSHDDDDDDEIKDEELLEALGILEVLENEFEHDETKGDDVSNIEPSPAFPSDTNAYDFLKQTCYNPPITKQQKDINLMIDFLVEHYQESTKPFIRNVLRSIDVLFCTEIGQDTTRSSCTNKRTTALYKALQLYKCSQEYNSQVSHLFQTPTPNATHYRCALDLFDFLRARRLSVATTPIVNRAVELASETKNEKLGKKGT